MKVKQEKFDKSKPKPTPPADKKPDDVQVTNVVDLKPLEAPINKLIEAMKESQIPGDAKNIIFAIKGAQDESTKKQEEFIKYLGEKVDVLVKALREKPSSFEFDVRRNNNGFIKTVVVKPVKE